VSRQCTHIRIYRAQIVLFFAINKRTFILQNHKIRDIQRKI